MDRSLLFNKRSSPQGFQGSVEACMSPVQQLLSLATGGTAEEPMTRPNQPGSTSSTATANFTKKIAIAEALVAATAEASVDLAKPIVGDINSTDRPCRVLSKNANSDGFVLAAGDHGNREDHGDGNNDDDDDVNRRCSINSAVSVESNIDGGGSLNSKADTGCSSVVASLADDADGDGQTFIQELQARMRSLSFMSPLRSLNGDSRRFLVVDDCSVSRRVAGRLLMNHGQDVMEAIDGLDCLRMVKEAEDKGEPFDVVLMDEDMPYMSGRDATKLLRERGFTNPIIGLSGEVRTYVIKGFIEHGANAVLSKPLNIEELQIELEKCFATAT
jgi:CheY-like chemotaxis protein